MSDATNAPVCPFLSRDHGLSPSDPCPVCGDLGFFPESGEEAEKSNCVENDA